MGDIKVTLCGLQKVFKTILLNSGFHLKKSIMIKSPDKAISSLEQVAIKTHGKAMRYTLTANLKDLKEAEIKWLYRESKSDSFKVEFENLTNEEMGKLMVIRL